MRIAFVGVKRKFQELDPDYRETFIKTHLELPYYYSLRGDNEVFLTTVDHSNQIVWRGVTCVTEEMWKKNDGHYALRSVEPFGVIIHWRKWFPELARPEAINVINCQDHSFSPEWIADVKQAYESKQLHGILCFPGWHRENLIRETGLPREATIPGLTLGVDPDIYYPEEKDPFSLLWASDPGRGLTGALEIAFRLFAKDNRYRLHVCHPDYVNPEPIRHPAIVWHGFVPNGPKLQRLFNQCMYLPYTSTFKEPSSRAVRQFQCAGGIVLYPRDMGTPSEYIVQGKTGLIFASNEHLSDWADFIFQMNTNHKDLRELIGRSAREQAVSESWAVQTTRFNEHFSRVLKERK